jgi:release factor glutamine methyltransferase
MEYPLPSPKLDHTTFEDWQHVYEPAEDSFLLCDALHADIGSILASTPSIAVEIGLVLFSGAV